VCVEKCPTEHFAFAVNSKTDTGWKEKMYCTYGVSPQNPEEAKAMIDSNKCAEYYLKSKEGESAVCTFSVRSFQTSVDTVLAYM
jgi:hypothetical protein